MLVGQELCSVAGNYRCFAGKVMHFVVKKNFRKRGPLGNRFFAVPLGFGKVCARFVGCTSHWVDSVGKMHIVGSMLSSLLVWASFVQK